MADDRTYGFSKDDASALMQSIGTREGTFQETRPRGGSARIQVVLTTDLVAAVNTKRDPSTATARILRRKTDGDLTLSTDSITIVNRFTQISVDAGTYAKAEHIDGEWQLYAADCPGGSASSGGV
jgi:hypothetical protein